MRKKMYVIISHSYVVHFKCKKMKEVKKRRTDLYGNIRALFVRLVKIVANFFYKCEETV